MNPQVFLDLTFNFNFPGKKLSVQGFLEKTILAFFAWISFGKMIFRYINFSNGGDRTPFDEEDWDDHGDPLEDDGRPGNHFFITKTIQVRFQLLYP